MIPVTLLTGFLGSGKTTLLSRLLRRPSFARTAVVINEFGEIGLDHELVERGDETVVTLSNGCLCCRVSSDLAQTLAHLEQRRAIGEIAFDRVMIETSGLADPVPILQALAGDRLIGSAFAVGGVVTAVDALAGTATLQRYAESRRQVAIADVLLVTKADLSESDADGLRDVLAGINPTAEIMDVRDWDGQSGGNSHMTGAHPPGRAPLTLRVRPQRHSHNFSTISLTRQRPLSALTLPLFLEGLARHLGPRLLRAKGLVAVRELPDQPMAIHAVQHMIHKPVFLAGWPSPDHSTRIVLIGHDLPEQWPGLLLDALEAEVTSVTRPAEPIPQPQAG
ncbi:GTP-binding protein [Bradyrhizobium sp. LHD-71]|uniref:CobW family GTP-binding protein n=1 Tax=Bradyrhizobium sp. LHD-71 TaxID=3072141 RepID=UPI00280D0F26|nr:GTP-binding protein [Bradyrhizobium sp. LHD-71]MDQ8729282.1 GTP-binding protein [Bradyrhizobium sp. LHD-71]